MVVTCGDLVVSWWVLVLRVWQSIFAAPEGEASLIQAEPATANRLALCPNCLHGTLQRQLLQEPKKKYAAQRAQIL